MGRGQWTALGRAKVESSGLTVKQAEALGMYEVPSAKLLHESFDARASLVLPYFDYNGNPLSHRPRGAPFYRIRYLEKDHGFNAVTEEKEKRYVQPPGTGVCAYLPRNYDWTPVLNCKGAGEPVIITEGELKASAAASQGFATIGLGGVWSFRRSNEGVFFLPELDKISYVNRDVHIVFDSDYADKPQICGAINVLCDELTERGANVFFISLPEIDGVDKTGLDDYFLEHTAEDFMKLMATAQPLGMCKKLWRMNDEVLYVDNPGLILQQKDAQKISPSMFKEHSRWSTVSTPKIVVTPDGTQVRKASAAAEWIKWPLRRAVKRLTYAPGQPLITETNEYNQWPGWGVQPAKGTVEPWLKLTKFLFRDSEPKALEWFYDWCAYPIQNPGVKMFTAVVIHGTVQGTGKTLVGYTLGEIYGKNFKEIKNENLENTHWAENKQFILGDEISGSDNRAHADTLKRLITQRTVEINIKFVPQYDVPDRINYLFTSNHADAFFLEDTDRRNFVVEVTADIPLADRFFEEYDEWLWRKGGPSYLMQWLLDRKIDPKFNPNAPAMKTKAKERMILHSKGDLTMWVRDMRERPDQFLHMGPMYFTKDMFTSRELLQIYTAYFPENRVTVQGMNKALIAAGMPQVANGEVLRGPDGKMNRYHAVRNIQHWVRCKNRKLIEQNLARAPTRRNT